MGPANTIPPSQRRQLAYVWIIIIVVLVFIVELINKRSMLSQVVGFLFMIRYSTINSNNDFYAISLYLTLQIHKLIIT